MSRQQFEDDMMRLFHERFCEMVVDWVDTCERGGMPTKDIMLDLLTILGERFLETVVQTSITPEQFGEHMRSRLAERRQERIAPKKRRRSR